MEIEAGAPCARPGRPSVSVTWVDDTRTELLVHRSDVPDEWNAMLPADVHPKVVSGVVVHGLEPHETLLLVDLRLLKLELMTSAIARRRWWWWWQLVRRRIWV